MKTISAPHESTVYTGWARNHGSRWMPVCEAETEHEAWQLLLEHRSSEKTVTAEGQHPSMKARIHL